MLKVISPATEQVIKELQEDTAETVREKFKKAQAAQKKWAQTTLDSRIKIFQKAREIWVTKKEHFAQVLSQETGKPISQARNEVNGILPRLDFFIEKTPAAIGEEKVFNDATQKMEERISHEPLGVIANISAWNYPYFVGANVFIPALLTGNAVLYKPSEFSSMVGLAIADWLYEAGIPRDVFIPLIGTGAVGAELLKQPIAGVFFTGSYATGRKIAEAVAGKMIKVQLELGGKDPVYICEDVNVRLAAEGVADGAFYNTGQSCCSVERIYVHSKIYNEFVDAFAHTVKGFVTGEPSDDKTYIGPLTRQAQIAVLEKQVTDAQSKGAKLLCGGKKMARKGYYFEPTVFTDVNHTMELMREESFGPIIGIQKVSSDEEAVKLMNDTEYGLTAGVYTQNYNRASGILAQINSGSVYWNCCDRVSPRLPWSGRGHSGMGHTLSTYGIQTFTQPKGWHLRGDK